MNRCFAVVSVVALLMPLAGCDSATVVEGAATLNGEPIASGTITFLPADGAGPASGGTILQGRYMVEGIAPGDKVVQILRNADVPVIRHSDDPALVGPRAREETNTELAKSEAVRKAKGNNKRVAIVGGRQSLDIHLRSNESVDP